jgi:hypothetical protein
LLLPLKAIISTYLIYIKEKGLLEKNAADIEVFESVFVSAPAANDEVFHFFK